MATISAFSLVTLAGISNGSFAVPAKKIKHWAFENLWLQFAFWAFLILPTLFTYSMAPNFWQIYQDASSNLLLIMVTGGTVFGVGQVCFCLALHRIGLSLSFLLNVGIATALGTLYPLITQHTSQLLTPFGISNCFGTALIVVGLWLAYQAGRQRDLNTSPAGMAATASDKATHFSGVGLVVVSGLASAVQNITFALTQPLQADALKQGLAPLVASTAVWPGFALAAFIPYAAYMIFLLVKNQSFGQYFANNTRSYWSLALLMGVFWYGSLILYSQASLSIGELGPVIGWPMFMGLIILTSNFWGFWHGEWANCRNKTKVRLMQGMVAMVCGITVLGYSAHLAKF